MADEYSGISGLDSVNSISSQDLFEVAVKTGNTYEGKSIEAGKLGLLPSVTSSDSGKFLIVNAQGVWEATTIAAWNGGSF